MPRNKGKQKSRKRKTTRRRFRYRCRKCGKRFNHKKRGGCPNCGGKSIATLGKKAVSTTTNRAGRRY